MTMWTYRTKQAAVIGAVAGLGLFAALYFQFGNPWLIWIIPFGAIMAAGTIKVLDNPSPEQKAAFEDFQKRNPKKRTAKGKRK